MAGEVQEYLLALSAGFLLSLVFVELVPQALAGSASEAPLLMLAGYAVLHFFEHTVVGHLHFGEETHHEVMVSRAASISTFLGLFVHAFSTGSPLRWECSLTSRSVSWFSWPCCCTKFLKD